jgi:TatD DNase family protein
MDSRVKPTELPDLGAMVADTHAHLDMLDDPAGALERAAMAHVGFVVTVVDATEAPRGTFDSLEGWLADVDQRLQDWDIPGARAPQVRIILGTHPHNAKDHTDEVEQVMRELARDERVAGVGEIGLDYHYDHSPRGDQRRVFRAQLTLAHELDLPVVVHLREAHEEGRAIIEELGVPAKGCVLHCFTEGPEVAREFLDLGCHISFAGPVTFGKGDAIRAAAAETPLERLLVETDSPFMAPAPYRGRTNEPAWVTLTAAKIAEVKGLPASQVAEAVLENARRVFGGA